MTLSTAPEASSSFGEGDAVPAWIGIANSSAQEKNPQATHWLQTVKRDPRIDQGTTFTAAPSDNGFISSAGMATASPSESPEVISTRVRFCSEKLMA